MASPPITRLSSKGQIVLPKTVREAQNLTSGDVFTVLADEDTIILQKVQLPSQEEFEAVMAKGREFAWQKGIKREDVVRAVNELRKERQ